MRLDIYLTEKGFAHSRTRASELIRDGLVGVNGKATLKPSYIISDGDSISVADGGLQYVSRGALKLLHAVQYWNIEFNGLTAVDLGASTGGFCEVMLELGAKKVFAVDIGHGQLHEKIASDKRVVNLEGINARSLDSSATGGRVDIVCADLSFISQTLTLETVTRLLKNEGEYIGLIKPQFEVGRQKIGKNGIVKDKASHADAIEKVTAFAASIGLECVGVIPSPILGGDGNREFLARYIYTGKNINTMSRAKIEETVNS